MLIHEILKSQNPILLRKLCETFHIDEDDLLPSKVELGYFNAFYEMTHDSEGRYLDYTRGRK